MKKYLYAFIVMSCLFIFSIPAYSGNINGQWKKVDSYQSMQILDNNIGIAIDLRNGKAIKFNYQLLSDELISFEISHSNQVQKYKREKNRLILANMDGSGVEIYERYDDKLLPGMIKNDFQRYLDRNFPGLCQIKRVLQ